MNKPVLFIDFDGTLCHDRFWRSLSVQQYEKIQSVLFGEDKTYLQEWMKGKRTAEEVNDFIANEIGISPEALWEVFVQDAKTMRVPLPILQRIDELREKYVTVLITVNMDSFSRFTVPALQLEEYFDAISNSYDEGLFKQDNDGEVFQKYLTKYGAAAVESIAIDDSPSVCDTFTRLGGTAYRVTSEKNISDYISYL